MLMVIADYISTPEEDNNLEEFYTNYMGGRFDWGYN